MRQKVMSKSHLICLGRSHCNHITKDQIRVEFRTHRNVAQMGLEKVRYGPDLSVPTCFKKPDLVTSPQNNQIWATFACSANGSLGSTSLSSHPGLCMVLNYSP
ncbi:hypothetical protein CHARACLAT_022874 [Characodon lateralis]|uniref:Uncharacterized protein n=1 Tax=Characodon lateralis TaxID=208331 RepID=A0ABU7EC28_9TELE|nr:hypothetical protein [Characodon lateralis]